MRAILFLLVALPAFGQVQVYGVGSSSPEVVLSIGQPSTSSSLRQAASARGLYFGASVSAGEFLPGVPDPLISDVTYVKLLTTHFSQIEPTNAGKNFVISTGPGTYNFSPFDEIVNFGKQHDQAVHGHTLLGFGSGYNAAWLRKYAQTATPGQMDSLLASYVTAVVTHYRGKLVAWDVVNEALSDQQGSSGFVCKSAAGDSWAKPLIWNESPGTGLSCVRLIEQAFSLAHAADPDAKLWYNDYDIEMPGPKFSALLAMLTQLLAHGTPIDGVGFQFHMLPSKQVTLTGALANMRRIASLGLKVRVSEADWNIPVNGSGLPTSAGVAFQVAEAQTALRACMGAAPACVSFQVWGVDDTYGDNAGDSAQGSALLFAGTGVAKPVFYSVLGDLLGQASSGHGSANLSIPGDQAASFGCSADPAPVPYYKLCTGIPPQ